MISSTSFLASIIITGASFFLLATRIASIDAFVATPSSMLNSETSSFGRHDFVIVSSSSFSSDPVDVLSDYMTKSHEEKLRAIKSVEDKKNIEISVLKEEIERLKSVVAMAGPSSSASLVSNMNNNNNNSNNNNSSMDIIEMQSKLASYQSFMAEYIVDSQNQKLAAVREAESRIEKKFLDKIEKMMLSTKPAALSRDSSSDPTPTTEGGGGVKQQPTSLFQKRNMRIIDAANHNAKQSRWGTMEIERAKEQQMEQQLQVGVEVPPMVQPPPAVMTLTTTPAAATTTATTTLFERRNAQVIASFAAGKSRWGEKEVERAATSSSSSSSSSKTTTTMISLEERVNLGARLLGVA